MNLNTTPGTKDASRIKTITEGRATVDQFGHIMIDPALSKKSAAQVRKLLMERTSVEGDTDL